jgi:hypothetical protein
MLYLCAQMETFEEYLRTRRTRSEALSNGSGSGEGPASPCAHGHQIAGWRPRMHALKKMSSLHAFEDLLACH